MKRYEGKYNKKSKGVFAISLVKAPATEETFIAMAKQEKIVKFAKVDEEQRILMGLVLQPDQLIYRVDEDGNEFEMFFSAETIKDFSQNFFQSGFQLNSKLEHDEPIEGVTFVESWLVENPKVDKSAAFGLEYPRGSWLVSMKVDNDDIWNNYIKTGELKGFSIDGMVELEEVNFKSNIQMSKSNKNILALLKQIVSGAEQEVEVTLGSVKSGELDIQFDGESLEVGTAVFLIADEESMKVIKEILDDMFKAYAESMEIKMSEMLTKLSDIEAKNVELKEQVVTLSAQPSVEPVSSQPKQVTLTKQGRILEAIKLANQNK